ncbi:MAG: G8 domain-containing protein [bacterium]|jgi:hypothetical protein|nr:G8 domain-containing protein [candidate division KSB1 bacterium]MDH7561455.1 G8 domain-containing protein [bacterium]
MSKRCIVLSALFFASLVKADIYFTNAGGHGKWNNPANWSNGNVPAKSDHVIIPVDKTCVLPTNVAVKAITVVGRLMAEKDNKLNVEELTVRKSGSIYYSGDFCIRPLSQTTEQLGISNEGEIRGASNFECSFSIAPTMIRPTVMALS